ncbi:MAG: phosphotransacetylase [SAR324 cluster bacterium]|jgi:phosphate acetyltransferase|nr:phosphotransacetylase [SAR324 cluster bacterium]MDP7440055.1 phosphotransacetylase [SAR324 cluster bacterium]MDP7615297.1 phosphotransacetylase [SAR324 cluster bacterium]
MQINKYQERVIEIGRTKSAKLILPEKDDPRVSLAKRQLSELGYDLLDPEDFRSRESHYAEILEQERFFNKMTEEAKIKYMNDPLNFSMMMVSNGDADGLVAGAVTSTSDVLRSAIRIVGVTPHSKWVSSSFFMISPNADAAYTFADCAVIPEPTSDQLASIAGESASNHHLLTGEEPRVAFLSFSTKGSANHRRVSHVKDAVKKFSENHPDILHDGELQLDSALVPDVAANKAKDSPLAGKASVLIFPSLEAGNIAYKITERLAGYTALGPLLQGLNKPVHDLSRGCSSADIVNVATIAAMQK